MEESSKYDDIRFFNEKELQVSLRSAVRHPMIKTLLQYSLPDKDYEEIKAIVESCKTVDDFQREVICRTLDRLIAETSSGLTTVGFENLDPKTSYLYISNHRDIILDTCLINYTLFQKDLIRTASAIGDNLIQRPFVNVLSKLTRNFIVKRGLSPRETLLSSKKLSEYIAHLINDKNRSVWLAQRQGRTKDGNDITEQGVLKMLTLGAGKSSLVDYMNNLRIVPVSISYEYDPTDILKVPELVAKAAEEEYEKSENEDFNTIMSGALGQKKHIHITAGETFKIDNLGGQSANQILQRLVHHLNDTIQQNYKLWPTNYIAHDILTGKNMHLDHYTDQDRKQFERRLSLRVKTDDPVAIKSFLEMYARPVANKMALKVVHEG